MPGSAIGKDGHTFGRARPSAVARHTLHTEAPRDTTFRDLPAPTRSAPFRLDLADVVDPKTYKAIVKAQRLTIHLNGDMGGIGFAVPQQLVANGMESDIETATRRADRPAFLYITGDCVYFNGEIDKYHDQFYLPYEHYNAPIFAVPGNHDGENLVGAQSLDGFVRNFCAPAPTKRPEAGESNRTAMTQPNVYWTLVTPLVNIVGLYSNVPANGEIDDAQRSWLVGELADLPKAIPIIVALHHPVYSADNFHSGSTVMKALLEGAAEQAGRHPDMIVAGHVHDYQRLTKHMPDGSQVPYLVTGAGGYHNLHSIRHVNGQRMIPPVVFNDKDSDPVTLEAYSDDHHGFLRCEVTPSLFTGKYFQVPRPQDPYSKGNQLIDRFDYDWAARRYRPNSLGGLT